MSERSKADEVREIMDALGVDEHRAEFIRALDAGEVPGDEVTLDADGNPLPPEPPEEPAP